MFEPISSVHVLSRALMTSDPWLPKVGFAVSNIEDLSSKPILG
jgi:hypothetical protein